MTPSEQAKASGFKSLKQVSLLSGVKLRTLDNWHKSRPELFKVLLKGCSQCPECTRLEKLNAELIVIKNKQDSEYD